MAFVLEAVPGVRAVFAVPPRAGERDALELLVHVEPGDTRSIAAIHYALLKILRHEDCARISIVAETSKPPRGAEEVALSSSQRLAAMQRVSARARVLAEERAQVAALEADMARTAPAPAAKWYRVLLYSNDSRLIEAARAAYPVGTVQVVDRFWPAIEAAKNGIHEVVLCHADGAFGMWGFLECLSRHRPRLSQDVIIVADESERELVAFNLYEWKRRNRCLWKPVTVESLRLVADAPMGHEVVNVAQGAAAPQQNSAPPATEREATPAARAATSKGPKAIVLLVDDEPDTESLPALMSTSVHVIRVSNEWDALDKLALSEIDLLVCNASMKVAGDRPLYRLLWNSRPELKKVCALIVSPHRVPASARDGRTGGAVTRPITPDIVKELLAARALSG